MNGLLNFGPARAKGDICHIVPIEFHIPVGIAAAMGVTEIGAINRVLATAASLLVRPRP